MKILDRYILRAFFTNYFIAMFVLIGMYVVLDLFVNLDEFTETPDEPTSRTIAKIINFYGYNMFLYFSQLSGTLILAAACFTLGRALRTNEFTAVLASGTSLYRIAAPICLAALVMNGVWFINQEVVLPSIADKLARRHDDIEGRRTFGVWFRPDRDNTLLSASMFSPRSQEMRGVIAIKRDDRMRMIEVMRADRAVWDEDRQLWILFKGESMRLEADDDREALAGLGRTPVATYPSDLSPKELALQQASQWTNFISLRHLTRLQKRFPHSTEFVKVKHARLTTMITNMIMLLLGIPFFLNRERAPVLVAGGKCLLVCGACFVTSFLCLSVELVGVDINPALPAWIPIFVFGPIAMILLGEIKT
ncbi:MAG: LptF/LptG family permease [Planctomycetota bacterium]|nr:LptF/LptG family permease [Planctomycetota bacterium]MCZ6817149.1 LptF/LptG family permease [Planctomycetota bacterium]